MVLVVAFTTFDIDVSDLYRRAPLCCEDHNSVAGVVSLQRLVSPPMNSLYLFRRPLLARSLEVSEPTKWIALSLGGIRGAKKKAAGSSNNGRDSAGRRLVRRQ